MTSTTPRFGRLALAFVLAFAGGGCASSGEPSARSLHRVDDQLVSSRAPHPRAYEAYLRARLALELEPPDLAGAATQIDVALQYDPFDPHLWTTRAEIFAARGELDEARRSLDEALALRPGYAPAEAALQRLEATNAAG